MLTDVTQEGNEIECMEPIIIIHELYLLSAEQSLCLCLELLYPCSHHFPLGKSAFHIWLRIADHSGSSSNKKYDLVPSIGQMPQQDPYDEVTRMCGICGRIDTVIDSPLSIIDYLTKWRGRDLIDESSGL